MANKHRDRESFQSRRDGRVLIQEHSEAYWAEKAAVVHRVRWTVCKGYAHPDETKEFNRLWKQFKESGDSEPARQELEDWIAQMNARPMR